MGMTGFETRYDLAHKPIKTIHFHPDDAEQYAKVVKGKNKMNKAIISDTLKETLDKHFKEIL